jgi:hypothetical protein
VNILEIGGKSWTVLDHRIEKNHYRTGSGVILLHHTAPLSCPVQGCMIEIPVPIGKGGLEANVCLPHNFGTFYRKVAWETLWVLAGQTDPRPFGDGGGAHNDWRINLGIWPYIKPM